MVEEVNHMLLDKVDNTMGVDSVKEKSYMRPAMVIPLETLPLNNSGKVDRRAIAAMPLPTSQASFDASKATPGRKSTLVEGELRLIWHDVISQAEIVNGTNLEPDTDSFHVGGNSLLLVRLRSAIQMSMGIALCLSDMYRSSALYGRAGLVTQQESSDYLREVIDWEAETALPHSVDLSYSSYATPIRTDVGLEILMTGSTSFLGKQILQSLLSFSSVSRIYYIAVDPDSDVSHPKDDRVTLYHGSLSEPMLGLKNAALPLVRVRDHEPPTDGSEGFTAAKWAGEIFLENLSIAAIANGSRELPVAIHRHWAIVGDEAPIEDALNALLQYSNLIHAVPRISSLNIAGYFDFLPVTDVADSVAEFVISLQPQDYRACRRDLSFVKAHAQPWLRGLYALTGTQMRWHPF
ncbi:hypothetical protein EDB82DRAFT_469742 [Fusarium venenatum]|uniref:uncharacterized protein n=1 Tax=Fusarium venenatum TaxID=56646 RepID=UPI001D7564BB|nr:hypothetical protein EDB82DRAFT_469742 [Fusarium venenatum]